LQGIEFTTDQKRHYGHSPGVQTMKRRTLNMLACATMTLGSLQGTISAATINYVGSLVGGEVTDWRSTGTTKTLDIDGSNAYGSSLGSVHWTVGSRGQQVLASSTLGWGFVGSGSQFINGGYPSIDNGSLAVSATVTNANAGIALTSFEFELTGVAADYTGKTVRVGIMGDTLTSGEWAADTFKGLRLLQTVGGSGDSGTIAERGGAAGNGVPEMYFFDISGVSPGNRFQIQGLNNVGGTSGLAGYIGPVSWDIAVVPEPSSLALMTLGFAGMIHAFRRRK
jgi:hypothetical protein